MIGLHNRLRYRVPIFINKSTNLPNRAFPLQQWALSFLGKHREQFEAGGSAGFFAVVYWNQEIDKVLENAKT